MYKFVARVAVLAAIAALAGWAALHRNDLDVAKLDAWLAQWGVLSPLVFVILYAIGTVAFVPGALFTLAGGALFGPVLGTAFSLAGASIGSCLSFLLARYMAADWVSARSKGWLKRLMDGVDAEGWRFVALVRLVPVFPFTLVNYALGLTRIGFWQYALTSAVCMAPGAAAYAWLGHAGREAAEGDSAAIRWGLLGLAALAATALLPRLIRQFRKLPDAGKSGS